MHRSMILNLLRVEALRVEEMIKRSFSENAQQRLLPEHQKKVAEGEKELNAYINAFIDKIKANGELKKITDKWMKAEQPPMPEKIEGVPFTAG